MFRDKNGWRVSWNVNGQRGSRYFSDRLKAEHFECEMKLGIVSPDSMPNERHWPTFEEFSERWLNEYSRVEKRRTTHDEDKRVVRLHLVPAFASKKIKHLRRADLVALRGELLVKSAKGKKGKTLHPKTVNNVLMVAKSIMAYAVDLELLTEHPWRGVKPVKVTEREFDFWQPAERDSFYAAARDLNPDVADLAFLACHTGLRKGELAALTWKAVDLSRRKLKVTASYSTRLEEVTATKGGEVAEVPLNRAAVELLTKRAEEREGLTVFPTPVFANLRRDFQSLCRRTGTRQIRFHDTRHTFASTLAMAGVDLLVIQELMRHKSYQMTLRYAHLHPSHLVGATEVLCGEFDSLSTRYEPNSESQTCKSMKSWRTLSDSNARPSGSKSAAS